MTFKYLKTLLQAMRCYSVGEETYWLSLFTTNAILGLVKIRFCILQYSYSWLDHQGNNQVSLVHFSIISSLLLRTAQVPTPSAHNFRPRAQV